MISILSNKIAWFGKYSGYECLTDHLPENVIEAVINASQTSLTKKVVGKYYQFSRNQSNISPATLSSGIDFLNRVKARNISHILYLETHLYLLSIAKSSQKNFIVGTIHLPFSQWSQSQLENLKNLNNAILLYESEIEKFQAYLPNNKIQFIRHGVDTNFFKPAKERENGKILCVGHYLRNFEMLQRVIEKLTKQMKHLTFHLVIPNMHRTSSLLKLCNLSNVVFYEKISDEKLLQLYQTSSLMLMPLNDGGANTAIVQALSCGTPIATTNNGGIKSYGGDNIFPVVENNDDNSMIRLVTTYLTDKKFTEETSRNLRDFALRYLDWKKIALEHIDYYDSLLCSTH